MKNRLSSLFCRVCYQLQPMVSFLRVESVWNLTRTCFRCDWIIKLNLVFISHTSSVFYRHFQEMYTNYWCDPLTFHRTTLWVMNEVDFMEGNVPKSIGWIYHFAPTNQSWLMYPNVIFSPNKFHLTSMFRDQELGFVISVNNLNSSINLIYMWCHFCLEWVFAQERESCQVQDSDCVSYFSNREKSQWSGSRLLWSLHRIQCECIKLSF